VISKINARMACRFLMTISLGCLSAAAQQDAPSPANSPAQPAASAPSQTEPQPTQDQYQVQEKVQSEDSAKSQSETKNQPQRKPAKKRKQSSAGIANPNTGHRASKRAEAPPPTGTPKKIVVRHGGAEEPTAQIVTGMTADEADRQRREAELLLSTTDEKLKEIAPRPRDSQQEETVSQIHNYMEGSRSALKQGDVSRAHTLALKAGLLADDLASH
jgi:hypothetical protein